MDGTIYVSGFITEDAIFSRPQSGWMAWNFDVESERNSFTAAAKWIKTLSITFSERTNINMDFKLLSRCVSVKTVIMSVPFCIINTVLSQLTGRPDVFLNFRYHPLTNLANLSLPYHLMGDNLTIILDPEQLFPQDGLQALKQWGRLLPLQQFTCQISASNVLFRVRPMLVQWLTLMLGLRQKCMRFPPELAQYIAEEYNHM